MKKILLILAVLFSSIAFASFSTEKSTKPVVQYYSVQQCGFTSDFFAGLYIGFYQYNLSQQGVSNVYYDLSYIYNPNGGYTICATVYWWDTQSGSHNIA